jgi:glutaminase
VTEPEQVLRIPTLLDREQARAILGRPGLGDERGVGEIAAAKSVSLLWFILSSRICLRSVGPIPSFRPSLAIGGGRPALARQRMKMDQDPVPGDHPETERVSTGVLPPDTDVQALISAGYERFLHLDEGAVADYIPALAAASPSAFGVCVAGVGGRLFSVGDADQEFAIESISKLFVFALVCHTLGHEEARRKLGVNSTGLPFNSVMAIELNAERTMNPLVNAGAMATTSLVPGTTAEEKFESIVAAMSRFAGRRLVMDDDVYESEAATNDRNRGIAHLLDGYGRMYCDPDLVTDVYTRQCSLRVSARDLAVMGATLANGGVNPVTGEQAIETRHCKRVLAVLATAGLYEHSGQWLYDVGLPGKSGVAGGIVTVSPGKGGVGTFSPPLDAAGNSVRGQRITRYLSEALGLNLFASAPWALLPPEGNSRVRTWHDPMLKMVVGTSGLLAAIGHAASGGVRLARRGRTARAAGCREPSSSGRALAGSSGLDRLRAGVDGLAVPHDRVSGGWDQVRVCLAGAAGCVRRDHVGLQREQVRV